METIAESVSGVSERNLVIASDAEEHGRQRCARAVVSTYHAACAVRYVAKTLGLSPDQITALADCCGRWTDNLPSPERLRESGFDPDSPCSTGSWSSPAS